MRYPNGLRHIVLCAFTDEASADQCNAVVNAFSALQKKIAEVRHFEFGKNQSPENLNDGYTHCFTLTFDGKKERDAYLIHPAHLTFVELLKPTLKKILVVDYMPDEE